MYVGDIHVCSPHFCPANSDIVVGMGHSVCRCVLSSLLVHSLHELSPLVKLGVSGGP